MVYSYSSFVPPHNNKQQVQAYLQIPQQRWLLQQPHDSGYADGDEDLFAQAFKSYETDMRTIDQWVAESQNTPALSAPSTTSSPFEYADSLVLPSEEWQPYDTLSTGYYLDRPTYDMASYQGDLTCMKAASIGQPSITAHDLYQPCNALSQPPALQLVLQTALQPALQPSLMEDTYSLPESPFAGRPRQREHHTAVEQRYRKNLNQQFANLRLAVPEIQTSQPQRAGQAAKPSKCEVLIGAVDYIKRLEEENRRLRGIDGKDEASRKRARTMG